MDFDLAHDVRLDQFLNLDERFACHTYFSTSDLPGFGNPAGLRLPSERQAQPARQNDQRVAFAQALQHFALGVVAQAGDDLHFFNLIRVLDVDVGAARHAVDTDEPI